MGQPNSRTANATPFLQLNLNPATFTARMETGETFAQSYDFRNSLIVFKCESIYCSIIHNNSFIYFSGKK